MPTGPGDRLDRYLVRNGLAPSRRAAQELIASGMVRVNGVRSRKARLVGPDERIEVFRETRAQFIEPNPNLHVEILYEDEAMIVANKPGGIPCHPLRAGERGTVMNAVAAQFPETATVGDIPREGGLVHRLDTGTSGALLIARTADSLTALRRAIKTGKIARTYRALVAGNLASRTELTSPIAHHPANPRKMVRGEPASGSRSRAGRTAVTIVEPVCRVGSSTLIRVTPLTGSRHQIRVHLASAGFPIVGDILYGGPATPGLPDGRFWLHLSEIELDSPARGHIQVAVPLSSELKKLLR